MCVCVCVFFYPNGVEGGVPQIRGYVVPNPALPTQQIIKK